MNTSILTSGMIPFTQLSVCSSSNNLNRGTRFSLSRDELLTLPEFVLLSLFPNGLLPDGHATANGFDGDVFPIDVRKSLSCV